MGEIGRVTVGTGVGKRGVGGESREGTEHRSYLKLKVGRESCVRDFRKE